MRSIHLALALAGLALPVTVMAMHNHLTKSTPVADETVAQSPKEIRLWFADRKSVV
jgi:methionine-rich copper-binding protein CopC